MGVAAAASTVWKRFLSKQRREKKANPAEDVLQRRRKHVLVQHEQVRGLALHREPVGVAVELHRAHEVLELGHDVGQLRGEEEIWIKSGLRDFIELFN